MLTLLQNTGCSITINLLKKNKTTIFETIELVHIGVLIHVPNLDGVLCLL